MLYYKNLENKVFEAPTSLSVDNLIIISGYIGVKPIERLLTLPSDIHATVIYGIPMVAVRVVVAVVCS